MAATAPTQRRAMHDVQRPADTQRRAMHEVQRPADTQRRAMHDVQRPAEAIMQDDVRQYARRNATFLFTDIVGSTQLLTLLGEEVWMEALRQHNDVVINAVDVFGGTYLKFLGDGWMIAFTCPRDAIDAAVVMQRVLTKDPSPDGFFVRIGVHSGMAMLEDDEFVGKDVVLASRIAREARPAEILASSDVVDALGAHDARFDDGRLADLKGLGPHLVFGVRWERTGRGAWS